jgi:phage shock protein PspC (stress-responsive transcriptional regulator)
MNQTSNHQASKGTGLDGLFDALRRPGIARASDGRWFAGVASGLARRLGVDPLVIRAAFILLGLLFGVGLTVYFVLWLLMPDERGRISLEQAVKYGEGHSIFLLIVTGVIVVGGFPWFGNDNGGGFRFFGFLAVAFGAWYYLTRTDSGRDLMKSAPWLPKPPGAATGSPDAEAAAGSPAASTMSTGNAAANAGTAWPAPTGAPVARATTPVTLAVPTPPVERTRGIGFAAGLLVLGGAILAAVGASSLAETNSWAGSHMAIAIASGLGVLGLGILVAGIAGRRAGWLAPFAVLAMVASTFASLMPSGLTVPFSVGERTHAVTTLTGDTSFDLGVGSLRLDLTEAEFASTSGADTVEATVGLGELEIIVPDDIRVTVNAKGRAGEVLAYDSDKGRQYSQGGTVLDETLTYGPATGTEEIIVNAEVGLGQITIRTGGNQ